MYTTKLFRIDENGLFGSARAGVVIETPVVGDPLLLYSLGTPKRVKTSQILKIERDGNRWTLYTQNSTYELLFTGRLQRCRGGYEVLPIRLDSKLFDTAPSHDTPPPC